MRRCVAVALDLDVRSGFDLPEIVSSEADICRADILLDPLQLGRPGDRDDIGPLRQQPRQRNLCGRRDIALAREAALRGSGIAYLPEDYVAPDIAAGRLTRVLGDWSPPFPGYHLYYPSRRHQSPALSLLIEALRFHD